jgi:methionyl-tRNA synthetase
MDYKCNCPLSKRLTGDGCDICNTQHSIDQLPRPAQLAEELKYGFSDEQATMIAADIYQPLLNLIIALNNKIEQLRRQAG